MGAGRRSTCGRAIPAFALALTARAAAAPPATVAHAATPADQFLLFALVAIIAAALVATLRRIRRPISAAAASAAPPATPTAGAPQPAPGRTAPLAQIAAQFQEAIAANAGGTPASVLLIDLDRFGLLNAAFGQNAGDEILERFTERVAHAVAPVTHNTPPPVVLHVAGDEFAVLLRGPDSATAVAERIHAAVGAPLTIHGHEIGLSAAIGIAVTRPGAATAEHLLRDASIALSRAKHAGTARHTVFDPAMHDAARGRLGLESALRRAIDAHTLQVFYQPVVDLTTGRLAAFEALARWTDPVRGVVPPSEFIGVAEETGLIIPLGQLILDEACAALALWSARASPAACPAVNVNVSRRQLLDPGFAPLIQRALARVPHGAALLRLEVTESAIMAAPEAILDSLNRLAAMGVQLQMDDFGIGLSSLVSLKRFPFDVLKIDQEFVRDLCHGREYMAIMEAVVSLAHNLGMSVTAEGVETAQQFAVTQALSCDFAQGFLFSPAVSAAQAAELIGRDFRVDPAAGAGGRAVGGAGLAA